VQCSAVLHPGRVEQRQQALEQFAVNEAGRADGFTLQFVRSRRVPPPPCTRPPVLQHGQQRAHVFNHLWAGHHQLPGRRWARGCWPPECRACLPACRLPARPPARPPACLPARLPACHSRGARARVCACCMLHTSSHNLRALPLIGCPAGWPPLPPCRHHVRGYKKLPAAHRGAGVGRPAGGRLPGEGWCCSQLAVLLRMPVWLHATPNTI
jgi:hypothetical protein